MNRYFTPLAIAGACGLALAMTPVSAVMDGFGVRLILNDALAQGGPPEGRGGGRPDDAGGGPPEDVGGGPPEDVGGGKPDDAGGGKPENAGGGRPEGVGGPPADRGPGEETRGGEQLAAARERYQTIFGGEDDGAPEDNPGDPEVTLTDDQTAALIEGGWESPPEVDDGFANHGERINTFVALAKALGYSPSVGALQANFPDAVVTGDAPPEDPALVGDGAVADADEDAGDWTTINLDVDGDGIITLADLEAALGGGAGAVAEGDGAAAGGAVDADGNPIVELDADGNPIVELDADGNPIVELDADGNPIVELDADGNPIVVEGDGAAPAAGE
ncbi:MAG: hypothetical protein HOB82_05615 [Alphaproteobacteria bacterium]|nr:hypothetical protein [Alphaproteobacteria bacterium]